MMVGVGEGVKEAVGVNGGRGEAVAVGVEAGVGAGVQDARMSASREKVRANNHERGILKTGSHEFVGVMECL
jgi:hypothetical protein